MNALGPTAGLTAIFLIASRFFPNVHIGAAAIAAVGLLINPIALAPVAVALIVAAAGLQLVADRSADVALSELKSTWVAAAMSAASVVALATLTAGPFPPSGAGSEGGGGLGRAPVAETGDGNAFSRFVARTFGAVARWVGAGDGTGGPGGEIGFASPEPESDVNWARLLMVVAIVAAVALVIWLAWRWLRSRPRGREVDGGLDWAVRSLDDTGRRVSRPRRTAEDPAAYGEGIEPVVGDGRLAHAGQMVSHHLYRPPGVPATVDERSELQRTLDGLIDLPSAPKPKRGRPGRRQVVTGIGLLGVIAFVGYSLWRGPFWMDDRPTASMLTAPASDADGYRWVLCAVDAVGDGSVETFESRGFVDRQASIVAIESYGNGFGRTFVAVGDGPVSSVSLGAVGRNDWVNWPRDSDPATAASVDMRELRSMNGVVSAFGLEDAVTEGPVARDIELYQAWERPNKTQADGDLISFGDASVDFNRFLAASAHRVEVWADGDGSVEHLRVSLQEFGETTIELRFVDSVPDIEPPELGGRTRMSLFGDCPASDVAEPDMGWLGFESYDATVSTIANIAVDEQGQAYDYAWRADGEHESESLGVVQLDLGALFLLRASSIAEEEPTSRQVDVGAGGPVEMTVSRVAFDDSGWTSALRFDLVGGEVDAWARLGDHDCVYYSPVAIGPSSDGAWPGLVEDALSGWPDSTVVIAGGKPWPGLEASEGSCLQLFVGKADDEVQAVLLAYHGVAFRLVAPDGTPPEDVQVAQRLLQACVDGDVEIEEFGRCRQ